MESKEQETKAPESQERLEERDATGIRRRSQKARESPERAQTYATQTQRNR